MTVFLFSDIEGSTQKWERYPDAMKEALRRHDEIFQTAIAAASGVIVKHTGDGIFAVFEQGDPFGCALRIQKAFQTQSWNEVGDLRIRIGLHAGLADKSGDDYFGPVINRTARVMAVAWGGQIILTAEARQAAKLPAGATLVDYGSHVLKDLTEPQLIYGLVHPDLKLQDFPPLRSLSSHPHNLPIQATPFMGREKELAETIKLLENPGCRLLTLIGPGGIGKTRLALQAAAERIEDFEHGVYLISLAPLSSAEYLVSAVAAALRFNFYSRQDEKDQLLNYLREKEMLLVMDNFEHMVQGASLIADILKNAPRIKIMVTSRELLNLKGEWVMQVDGLPVPTGNDINVEGFGAVQLFLYNAQRVNARLVMSSEEKQYVVRICQLVAGMPLGIELASSWLRSLSSREICNEIEKNLDFLVTTMRDVPERHRSLRAVFEYSWNLIGPDEQAALMKLSVFRGDFARDAAEKVAGTNLGVLAGLVDKSLLRKTASGRYEMVDILRPYAQEKYRDQAREREAIEDRFIGYYAEFLKDREEPLDRGGTMSALEETTGEIANIRAALELALERRRFDDVNSFLGAYAIFCRTRGLLHEGERIFNKIVRTVSAAEPRPVELLARAQSRWAMFLYQLGNLSQARSLLGDNLAVFRAAGNAKEIASALNTLGNLENVRGNYEAAQRTYEECLKYFKDAGDKKGILGIYNNLGVVAYRRRQLDVARKLYQDALALSREIGFEKGIANALGNSALLDHELGDYQQALRLTQEALEYDKKIDDQVGIANTIHNLGFIYRDMEDLERARKYYEESLAMRRQIGDRIGIAISLNNLGTLASSQGRYQDSLKLLEESVATYREMGDQKNVAMPLTNLGNTYLLLKKYEPAARFYQESLATAIENHEEITVLEALLGIADLLCERGLLELATEVIGFIERQETIADEQKKHIFELRGRVEPKLSPEALNRIRARIKIADIQSITLKIKAALGA